MYTFDSLPLACLFLSITMNEMNVAEVINSYQFEFYVMFNTNSSHPPHRQSVSMKALRVAPNICSCSGDSPTLLLCVFTRTA
jgi:hypothetical protein